MRGLMLLFPLVLAGCATGPFSANRDIDASSKQEGAIVSCSGYKAWGDCERAANKLCPNGYEVIGKEENIAVQARSLRVNCK